MPRALPAARWPQRAVAGGGVFVIGQACARLLSRGVSLPARVRGGVCWLQQQVESTCSRSQERGRCGARRRLFRAHSFLRTGRGMERTGSGTRGVGVVLCVYSHGCFFVGLRWVLVAESGIRINKLIDKNSRRTERVRAPFIKLRGGPFPLFSMQMAR